MRDREITILGISGIIALLLSYPVTILIIGPLNTAFAGTITGGIIGSITIILISITLLSLCKCIVRFILNILFKEE